MASGRLPRSHAIVLAVLAVAVAEAVSLYFGERTLAVLAAVYLMLSILYTLVLKHIPVIELVFVASGFVLRALGGASATRVPPSAWFLAVCSLGALMVAIAKRFTELEVLGADAAVHRPV
ncbi:MAG: UbiA family prenyltransferase, partial [Streptosporangiales bacterium]